MRQIYRFYVRHLNALMLGALIFGVAVGVVLPSVATGTALIGELFLRILTMLIVPVIVISILAGIVNLDSSGSLGRLGLKTIGYYACTTAFAVFIGLALVNLIQPGTEGEPLQVPHQTVQTQDEVAQGGLRDVIRNIIPKNIVKAALEGNALGLIFFSLFLGVALLSIKHPGVKYITSATLGLFEALIWMVDRVMFLAPIGILSLVANLVGTYVSEGQLSQLGSSIGWYTLTVASGLLFHGLITLPILAFFLGVRPFRFAQAMFPAISTSFSTASSAATLPITIDSLEHRAGVSNKTASFVAPLGATVNMDGTAIYEAIAAVFIANMYGIDLSWSQQITVFLTATFSAVGAAGIPGAGLIMMTLVLSSVGLPIEGIQLVVVVDRILDMMRTSVNVWGDSVGAAIIAVSEGETILQEEN